MKLCFNRMITEGNELMTDEEKAKDGRYPDTYAADYVGTLPAYTRNGVAINRSDSIKVIEGIALALGMPYDELAKKIADYYKEHETEISKSCADRLIKAIMG